MVFHFPESTVTVPFETEHDRDVAFDYMSEHLAHGDRFFAENDLIINMNLVQYLTKGEDKWQTIEEFRTKN